MRSTTAAGRVLAVGLMVLFSLALAGQSAWGAGTSTKTRPDKQGTCSYNKNPGAVSLAKAEVEGTGARKERLRKARDPRTEGGRDPRVADADRVGKCKLECTWKREDCIDRCKGIKVMSGSDTPEERERIIHKCIDEKCAPAMKECTEACDRTD